MKSTIFIILLVFALMIIQSSFADLDAGSYSVEDFETAVLMKATTTKLNLTKAPEEKPVEDRYYVTTDRECNLSLTTKEFVVSGKSAAKFAVTTSYINPYRPAFFSIKPPVTDWSQYRIMSFYLFGLPASHYPESTILIQLHSVDFDGINWKDQNKIRSYVINVPTGRPFQVIVSLRNLPFKEKVGKILFGVIRGSGTYYLDNFELQPPDIRSEVELTTPLFYPNKKVFIPDWISMYPSQIPMKYLDAASIKGFFDRDIFIYDGRIPVLLYFEYSKPVKKKEIKTVTIADNSDNIIKQIKLTFDKSDIRKSITLVLRGDIGLKVNFDKQRTTFNLKDIDAITIDNETKRLVHKDSGDPIHRGIISAYGGLSYTPDGKVDIDEIIARLKDLGVNGYTYLILQKSEAELAALPEFCEKAAKEGIEVWTYLVPPSEAPIGKRAEISEKKYPPFNMDYLKWAEAIAKISVTHPNLTLWMIDDFDGNLNYFTLDYTKKMYEISKQINPNLRVGYCVYHDRLQKYVDAGYMPYTDALLWGYQDTYWIYPKAGISAASLPAEINDYYRVCRDKPIIPCIYFTRHSSWPNNRPTLEYLAEAMRISYEQTGVVWVYTTPSPGTAGYELVKKYIKSVTLQKWSSE
jgi:hypothetical protein